MGCTVQSEKELIIVNDGSTDGTREALKPFENGIPGVTVLHNPVNLGKGSSVRIGFARATGDIVTISDADLELDPAEYLKLIEPIQRGEADVVFGSRFLDGGKKGSLPFTSRTAHSRFSPTCCFPEVHRHRNLLQGLSPRRAAKSHAARVTILARAGELTAQVLKHGYRLLELPIGYSPRSHEEGKKSIGATESPRFSACSISASKNNFSSLHDLFELRKMLGIVHPRKIVRA